MMWLLQFLRQVLTAHSNVQLLAILVWNKKMLRNINRVFHEVNNGGAEAENVSH
jgi:HAMP domain-containing protein